MSLNEFNIVSNQRWLYDRDIEFSRFLDSNFPLEDQPHVVDVFMSKPYSGKTIIEDFSTSNPHKVNEVIQICSTGSKIIFMIGNRRAGKTAEVTWLTENIYKLTGRKIYYYNIFRAPEFAEIIYDMSEVENGSIVVIDEASITASARDSTSGSKNRGITSILPVLGHKDITFIIISQNSSITDINFSKLVDIKLFKPLSGDALANERTSMVDELTELMIPKPLPIALEEGMFYTDECLLVYNDRYITYQHDLPECWSEKISKSYANITVEDGLKFARNLFLTSGYSAKDVKVLLDNYGVSKTVKEWETFKDEI
jgi:hypothetical protein